jgi:hypothetical protein
VPASNQYWCTHDAKALALFFAAQGHNARKFESSRVEHVGPAIT